MHDDERTSVLEPLQPLMAEAYRIVDEDFSSDAVSRDADIVSGFFFDSHNDLKRRIKGKWPLGRIESRQRVQQPKRLPTYRYTVEGDEVIDMVQVKKRTPRAFDRLADQRIARMKLSPKRIETSERSSTGGYLSTPDGFLNDYESALSLDPGFPTLKAFLYCVTRDQIFAALWALDLADKIEFVPTLDTADVVIHRRPRPGEKQFSYSHLLKQAKELGIPFCSINEPSKRELRASLIPAFELYSGGLPFDLDQPDKKGKPRRVRI